MPVTAEMTKAFSEAKLPVEDSGNQFEMPVEVKEENKVEAEKPKPEDKKEVLSNTESPKTEEKKPEVVEKTEVKVQSFEELVAERSEGKFKSWDEIQEVLNAPKNEFANEQVQKINDYVKNGGKFDDRWLYLQSTNFDKIEDPYELVAEAMRLEEPEITDKEIEFEIKSKYKIEDWSEDGEDDNEIKQVMVEKLGREAQKAKTKLIEFQKKSSFKAPEKSETEVASELKKSKEIQESWEKQVDEKSTDFSKITVKIDEKESFDVSVSDEERKTVQKMAKTMGTSMMPLLSEFMDNKGNIDVRTLQEKVYKMKNFDTAVKAAYQQGVAKGSLKEVKDIKNINFTAEGKSEVPKMKSINEQIAEGILATDNRK